MKNFGALQTLSIFGLIFSAIAQIILFIVDKHVENIWLLYPTWVVVFIVGWLMNRFGSHDHHH